MATVNETIVREFFELHGFFVLQHRKFVGANRRDEDEIDFFVVNPKCDRSKKDRPFVLNAKDLREVDRAVVSVRGAHTEVYSAGVLAGLPEMFRFVEELSEKQLAAAFGDAKVPLKILVLTALPTGKAAKQESIDLLRRKGIDGVILFPVMLRDLIERIETNRNYQKSDLLQTLRILKNYGLVKGRQLDLFEPNKKARKRRATKPE